MSAASGGERLEGLIRADHNPDIWFELSQSTNKVALWWTAEHRLPELHPQRASGSRLSKGLSGEQILNLLAVVPATPVGLRGRAISLTLTFTGRQRAEVIGMKAASIVVEDRVYYNYRGKGGKTGKRELPEPAYSAMKTWLACSGRSIEPMDPEASIWPDVRTGRGIASGTFYTNLRRYLKKAGLPAGAVHIFRHSAAKLRRDAGDSVEEVSRFWTTVAWR